MEWRTRIRSILQWITSPYWTTCWIMPKLKLNKFSTSELSEVSCIVQKATRPDIVIAVAELSQYLLKPYKMYMMATKWVLQYLKSTADAKLVFSGSGGGLEGLVGYTDSNWAGDRYDCKSQGGYIFKMARTLILWKLKKQTVIARLTTEAEYLVACLEATWDTQELKYQYWEVTRETMVPLIDWNSNGVLSTICSTIKSDKAKHIDVPFHNS